MGAQDILLVLFNIKFFTVVNSYSIAMCQLMRFWYYRRSAIFFDFY